MYTAKAEDALLAGSPDFVVDAIDNIDTKVGKPAALRHAPVAPATVCRPTSRRLPNAGPWCRDSGWQPWQH